MKKARIKETIFFNPTCPCSWTHVSGVLALLLAKNDLLPDDDLCLGAGKIATDSTYTIVAQISRVEVIIYEVTISKDFFEKMRQWILLNQMPEYLEGGGLLVDTVVNFSAYLASGGLQELHSQ